MGEEHSFDRSLSTLGLNAAPCKKAIRFDGIVGVGFSVACMLTCGASKKLASFSEVTAGGA